MSFLFIILQSAESGSSSTRNLEDGRPSERNPTDDLTIAQRNFPSSGLRDPTLVMTASIWTKHELGKDISMPIQVASQSWRIDWGTLWPHKYQEWQSSNSGTEMRKQVRTILFPSYFMCVCDRLCKWGGSFGFICMIQAMIQIKASCGFHLSFSNR